MVNPPPPLQSPPRQSPSSPTLMVTFPPSLAPAMGYPPTNISMTYPTPSTESNTYLPAPAYAAPPPPYAAGIYASNYSPLVAYLPPPSYTGVAYPPAHSSMAYPPPAPSPNTYSPSPTYASNYSHVAYPFPPTYTVPAYPPQRKSLALPLVENCGVNFE